MADFTGDVVDVQRTQMTRSGWRSWVTFNWIKTPLGILKIAECAVLLLALLIMTSVPNATTSGLSSIEFFLFVTTTTWVFVVITLGLYIFKLFTRLPYVLISNIVFTVSCGIAVLCLLIASSVIMHNFRNYDSVLASGSFGLIAMFMFMFEFVYYFINWRKNGPMASVSNPTTGASDIQHDAYNPEY